MKISVTAHVFPSRLLIIQFSNTIPPSHRRYITLYVKKWSIHGIKWLPPGTKVLWNKNKKKESQHIRRRYLAAEYTSYLSNESQRTEFAGKTNSISESLLFPSLFFSRLVPILMKNCIFLRVNGPEKKKYPERNKKPKTAFALISRSSVYSRGLCTRPSIE